MVEKVTSVTDFLAVVYFSYIREDETRDSSYCLSAKSKKNTGPRVQKDTQRNEAKADRGLFVF